MKTKKIKKIPFVVALAFTFFTINTAIAANTSELQLTIDPGTLIIDIVDSTNNNSSVSNPSVSLGNVSFDFSSTNASGTLGTSTERIWVQNPTATPNWTASLAATNTTDVWSSGGDNLDFNDPTAGGLDSVSDSDTVGGQLSINPSVASLFCGTNCVVADLTTNISKGSASSFEEGVIDSITIMTGDANTSTFAEFGIEDIELNQLVAPATPVGSYTLDMVLTII